MTAADDKKQIGSDAGAHKIDELQQLIKERLNLIGPPRIPDAQLLPAVQKLIAKMPPREAFVENLPAIAEWIGEAAAVLERWNSTRALWFRQSIGHIGTGLDFGNREYANALAVLHEARHDVELRGEIPTTAFVDKGKFHDYFEEVRNLIAQAKADILISDRYLNADFVERYLPFVTAGALVRLLVRGPNPTLLPAVAPAAAQFGLTIEVRAHDEVHDRYLFLDGTCCYHSGASFADGGKTGPTLVAPILGYTELLAKYNAMWTAGKILR